MIDFSVSVVYISNKYSFSIVAEVGKLGTATM